MIPPPMTSEEERDPLDSVIYSMWFFTKIALFGYSALFTSDNYGVLVLDLHVGSLWKSVSPELKKAASHHLFA